MKVICMHHNVKLQFTYEDYCVISFLIGKAIAHPRHGLC
jgi:hypothetical protein